MVLVIVPNLRIGGSEKVLKLFLEEAKSQSIDYDLFFIHGVGNFSFWQDFEYKVISKYPFIGYLILPFYLVGSVYTLTFTSNIYVNSIVSLLRRIGFLKSQKLIIRESTSFYRRFTGLKRLGYSFFHKLGYKFSDVIVFQTDEMLNSFSNNVSLKFPKKVVVENPADCNDILLKSKDENFLGGKEYFISLGRLVYDKGFDLLIHAYAQCSDLPNLYIFGSGRELPRLNQYIKSKGLINKVFISDEVLNPFPLIMGAKACIVPSRFEGFPNVLNEMILLNNNVGCSRCIEKVLEMNWILTCESNQVESLALMLQELNRNKPLTSEQSSKREEYIRKLSSHEYFCDLNSLV